MATLEQLETALRNADAAGDTSAAQTLAGEIVRMRSAAPAQPPAANPNAIGNPWDETKRAFGENLDAVKRVVTDYQPGDQFGHLGRVGSALAAVPGMIASPITGTARSLIGGGFEALDPLTEQERAKFDLPTAREAADKAMMGLSPRGYSPAGPRTTPPPVPSAEELGAAAKQAYNDPRVTNLRVKPEAASEFVANTERALLNNKIDTTVAPTVQKILDNLQNPRFGPSHTVDDFDLARQSLRMVKPEEMRAAGIVRKQIDDYLNRLRQNDLIFGDARAANDLLKEARGNYAAMKRSEQIENAMGRAENQTGSTYSGQNINNATRQQLRPILNEKEGVSLKKKVFEDYTPEEIEQIRKAVNGTAIGNSSRWLGNELRGKTPIPFAGSIMGWPFKAFADRSTRKQVELLAELLRSRSPLAQSLPPVMPPLANPFVGAPVANNSLLQLLAGMRPVPALMPGAAEEQQY